MSGERTSKRSGIEGLTWHWQNLKLSASQKQTLFKSNYQELLEFMAQFEAEKTTEWLSGRRESVADSLPAQATYSGDKGNYSGDSSGYSGDTGLYSGDRELHSNGKTPYCGDSGPKADSRDAFGRLISPALMRGYHSSALQWAVRHPFLPGRAVVSDTRYTQAPISEHHG